ncbi:aldo/keto reductase [Paenibacillus sp. P25]|nr:aldo/keto reductase [Paenibacillus sp. P25]
MRYNLLGNTGVLVSEISLGAMTFGRSGNWSVFGSLDEKAAGRLVDQALDAGVNFFDTSNIYADGQSEEILGKALKGKRHQALIATKVRGRTGPGPNDIGLSRPHIMRQVEESLKRLGTDYIDLYQIHNPDQLTDWEETLRALDDLVRARQGALHRRLQYDRLGHHEDAGDFPASRPSRLQERANRIIRWPAASSNGR